MDGQPMCSDPSNKIPDRFPAGEDFAYKRAEGDSSRGIISYELAIERELEYQKRMKVSLLQPLTNPSFLWAASQVSIMFLYLIFPTSL